MEPPDPAVLRQQAAAMHWFDLQALLDAPGPRKAEIKGMARLKRAVEEDYARRHPTAGALETPGGPPTQLGAPAGGANMSLFDGSLSVDVGAFFAAPGAVGHSVGLGHHHGSWSEAHTPVPSGWPATETGPAAGSFPGQSGQKDSSGATGPSMMDLTAGTSSAK
eukprot:CAMPEP_0118996138 /NCGR_PEP_ID=MMETSP1173-20130426/59547_1 /TAXON_ID=1034831 /ORGANISM="Rhizochromulina marina cf, Strain CCMP1243" /LENGTH=163 /DNA_ID=CAMNT_0006947513 /DNA_START=30 /DNA_END=518 /DNA_ORIENTATION=-